MLFHAWVRSGFVSSFTGLGRSPIRTVTFPYVVTGIVPERTY